MLYQVLLQLNALTKVEEANINVYMYCTIILASTYLASILENLVKMLACITRSNYLGKILLISLQDQCPGKILQWSSTWDMVHLPISLDSISVTLSIKCQTILICIKGRVLPLRLAMQDICGHEVWHDCINYHHLILNFQMYNSTSKQLIL